MSFIQKKIKNTFLENFEKIIPNCLVVLSYCMHNDSKRKSNNFQINRKNTDCLNVCTIIAYFCIFTFSSFGYHIPNVRCRSFFELINVGL